MPVPPPANARPVFQGILASVFQWDQELFDGSITTFECYMRADTVAVLAFLNPQTLLLTRQSQPAQSGPFWDPPGGCVEPGETMEHAAQRELAEETGYVAGRLRPWIQRRFEGMTRFEEAVYVATDLVHTASALTHDAGESIEIIPVDWNVAVQMCLKNEWRRADSMLAVLGMHFDPDARQRLEAFLFSKT